MIKTVSRRAALLASLFLPLCGTLAAPAARAEPLSLAVSAPPASIDPHYYTLTPSIMLSSHIFSRLVQRDENSRLAPDLAESWKLVDDTTWEFKLRPGVKFHNGADFTAEDVAYTLERVPTVQSPSSFSVYTRDIADVQVVDPLTIRLRLKKRRLKVSTQVEIDGVGRVDLLVGERLVIEIDSTAYHSGPQAYHRDRQRDLRLTLLGYHVLRFSWEQITFQWDEVEAAILAVVTAGDHVWPSI